MSTTNVFCWVDIPIANLDRAIKFYSAVLGKSVDKQTAPGFEYGLFPHDSNNVSGALVVMSDRQPSSQGPMVYLNVEGRLNAAIEAVKKHGGSIIRDKHQIGPHGFRAIIQDSEGNHIALHSPTE